MIKSGMEILKITIAFNIIVFLFYFSATLPGPTADISRPPGGEKCSKVSEGGKEATSYHWER